MYLALCNILGAGCLQVSGSRSNLAIGLNPQTHDLSLKRHDLEIVRIINHMVVHTMNRNKT